MAKRSRSETSWKFAKPLTANENRELARRYRDSEGAEKGAIRERMINGNQGLIVLIANRFTKCRLDFDDRVQEGNFGLFRAIESYNPDRQAFGTYAKYHIFVAIQRADISTGGTIRAPAWVLRTKREDKQGCIESGRIARATVSLDAMTEFDDGVKEFAAAPVAEDRTDADARAAKLIKAIGRLPDREQTVVKMRYGIDCCPASFTDISKAIRSNRTTARNLCTNAELRLRAMPELLEVA